MIDTKKNLLKTIYECPLRGPVEAEMRAQFENIEPEFRKKIYYALCLDEHIKSTIEYNKRMRPFLIRLSSQAAGLKIDDAFVKLAQDIEMKHQATLVIDDIQDGGLVRCGREPTYRKYGINTALDIAYLLAVSEPTHPTKKYFGTKGNILHNYSQFRQNCYFNLVSGQELDLSADKKKERKKSIKDYYNIVDGKTGALISLALHYGAMPYKHLYAEEKSQALTYFAMIFARLYQIKDDIDDIIKGVELDPSNVYYYVDENIENINMLYLKLHNELEKAHNKLLELKVVKESYLMELANVLLPKEEFDIKMLIK